MRLVYGGLLVLISLLIIAPISAASNGGQGSSALSLSNITNTPPIWAFNGSYEVYNGSLEINGSTSQISLTMTIVNVIYSNSTLEVIVNGSGSGAISNLSSGLSLGTERTFTSPFPYLAFSPTFAPLLPLAQLLNNVPGSSGNFSISVSSTEIVTTPAGTFSGFNISISAASENISAFINVMNGIFVRVSFSEPSSGMGASLMLVKTNVPATQFTFVNNLNNYLGGDNVYIIGGALTVLDAAVIVLVVSKRLRGH